MRALDEHDERLVALAGELGWDELGIEPEAPDPAWRPDRSALSARDRQVLDDVERHGWHAVHVRPWPGRDPAWTFTVGLPASFGHPELVVFGLDAGVAGEIVATAVEAVRDGRRYRPGEVDDDLLEGYGMRVLAARPHWYAAFLGYAQWFHESAGGFEVLQLVWPDRDGRWPWDPACALSAGTQPLLGAP